MMADTVIKRLGVDDCRPGLLAQFNRYQDIRRCWRKENGAWVLKDIAFIEDWDDERKAQKVLLLRDTIEFRRRGIGMALFAECCADAWRFGAKKLYVSANSSEETQAFYRAMGCVEATEISPELFEREPFDVHMEFGLG